MADVYGRIGNEEVELNNAATEATLRLLLEGIKGSSKSAADAISKFAKQSGVDPATIAAASTAFKSVSGAAGPTAGVFKGLGTAGADTTIQMKSLNQSIGPLIQQLVDGTAKASDVFGAFSNLPGVLGIVATGFKKVAEYQEANMKSYQQITAAGANFGGSLTDLRQAALNSYLTLDQLNGLLKNNGDAFSRMGGTVNDGAKAFTSFSKNLIDGDVGSRLLALGFTTEQLNNGMASYIAATGGRNRQQMQDTDALTKGAKAYFEQLDALATITGISREEQEKSMKERAANEAWQSHLQGLSIEERAKAEAAAAEARARGGKGAEQALMSAAMGLPPMTKAAQEYTAVARNGNAATMNLVKDIKDSSKSVKDVQSDGAAITAGLAKDGRENAGLLKALSMQGGELQDISNKMLAADTKSRQQGLKNEADGRAQLEQVQAEQRKRQAESQASEMAKAEKAMKQIGQVINDILAPAIGVMTSWLSKLVQGVAVVFKGFNDLSTTMKVGIALTTAYFLWKNKEMVLDKIKSTAQAGKDTLGKVKGMVPGHSKSNPLYVTIVDGGGIDDLLDKKGKKGKKSKRTKGKLGGVANAAKGGGALKGALSAGKVALKGAGVIGGLASALMLAGDLNDIKEKEKAGSISKEEASKERGGAVGEAGGGLAGGLAGAAAGAALGSVVPILGTAIGGLIGGAIGAWGGGSLGKGLGESVMGGPAKKMADGGIVTKPTMGLVGEGKEPEAVMPLSKLKDMLGTLPPMTAAASGFSGIPGMSDMFKALSSKAGSSNNKATETLSKEIETLNKNTIEMLKQLKEIADHTKQGVSATKSLNGNLFSF